MSQTSSWPHEKCPILVALVGTVRIFSAIPMLVFASWHHRRLKFNTGREGTQLFVGIWVLQGDCPNSNYVTRIVAQFSWLYLDQFFDSSSAELIQPFDPTGDDRLTQTVINFGSCQIQHLPREKCFVVITPPVRVCCWYSFQHWMTCPSCQSAKN